MTAGPFLLDGRARHVTVGAVDAAVAPLRLHSKAALLAGVEEYAGIGRHGIG